MAECPHCWKNVAACNCDADILLSAAITQSARIAELEAALEKAEQRSLSFANQFNQVGQYRNEKRAVETANEIRWVLDKKPA